MTLNTNITPRVSAIVCVVTPMGEVLLGLRKSPQMEGWQFPGGKVDAGELIEEAACRELLEETGVSVEVHQLSLVGIFQHANHLGPWVTFLYTARASQALQIENREPDKFIKWEWWSWWGIDALAAKNTDYATLYQNLREIVLNAARPTREERIPGFQTHCFECLRRIPCHCMRGIS